MQLPFIRTVHKWSIVVLCTVLVTSSVAPSSVLAQGGANQYLPAISATAPTGNDATGAVAHPNLIFILADDLDVELMNHLPTLKSLLTDQGTSFRNVLTSKPVCCVSRATILRGQYAHNTGVLDNNIEYDGGFSAFYQLGRESSTVGTWLQGAGYRTAFLGKYLNLYPEYANSWTYVPPGWTEWYAPYNGNLYTQYNYRLNENGTRVSYGTAPEDYLDDVLTNKAVDFIQRSTASGSPFFVYLNPVAPHEPAPAAPRHVDTFPGVTAPRRPSFNETDTSDKPAWLRKYPLLDAAGISNIDGIYRRQLQSMLAIEDMVKRLITVLQATGQLNNTYIFFTSDNGFHRGEHRRPPGKGAIYEEDIRVPLIVRGPGVPAGRVLDHLVANTDFAPTLAQLAGAAMPAFVDGRSLVPLLGGSPPPLSAWRHNVLLESWQAKFYSGMPDFWGVWTGRYVYVEYATRESELYDLQNDPYQLTSLHATADRALVARLAQLAADLAHCSGARCRALEDSTTYIPTGKLDNTLFWGDLYHNAPGRDPQQEQVPGGTCGFRCPVGAGNLKLSLLAAQGDITSASVRYGSAHTPVAMVREREVTSAFHNRPARAYSVWSATIPAASGDYDFVVNDGCTSAVLEASGGSYQNPLGQWLQEIDAAGGTRYATGAAASETVPVVGEPSVPDAGDGQSPLAGAVAYLPSIATAQEDEGAEDVLRDALDPLQSSELLDVVLPQDVDAAEGPLDNVDPEVWQDASPLPDMTEAAWGPADLHSTRVHLPDQADLAFIPLPQAQDAVGITAVAGDASAIGINLLVNGDFEQDSDGDGWADGWSRNVHAQRSSSNAHHGRYAIKNTSDKNSGYVVSQVVPNITPGLVYQVGSWINILSGDARVGLELEVRWLNGARAKISSSSVQMHWGPATNGWEHQVNQVLAPQGAVSAEVRFIINNLGTTLYLDHASFQLSNLVSNAGFELQPTQAERPDGWSADPHVSCSDRRAHSGRYAMRHSGNHEASYTVSQSLTNLTGAAGYNLAAWVNIPPTPDAFQFELRLRWLDSANAALGTNTIKRYTAATSGWDLASAYLVAPARAVRAQLLLVASSMSAVVYIDDVAFQPSSLLANGNIEQDTSGDNRPDIWTSSSYVTRSGDLVRSGRYAMRHTANNNASYEVAQTVALVRGATEYSVQGWVNIPATPDAFTFELQVRWTNSTGGTIGSSTVKRYTAATNGWNQALAWLVPPAGAVGAQVVLAVSSLSGTLFVDDVSLQVSNLLVNDGFESDSNGDTRPDGWTNDSRVTRSNEVVRQGRYAMRHSGSNEASYTTAQAVAEIVSQQAYVAGCYVNVPTTGDTFDFRLEVAWLDRAGGKVLGTSSVQRLTGPTSGWSYARRVLVAPVNARAAQMRMVVNGLSSTLYVDSCVFRP